MNELTEWINHQIVWWIMKWMNGWIVKFIHITGLRTFQNRWVGEWKYDESMNLWQINELGKEWMDKNKAFVNSEWMNKWITP